MFSFFRRKPAATPVPAPAPATLPPPPAATEAAPRPEPPPATPSPAVAPAPAPQATAAPAGGGLIGSALVQAMDIPVPAPVAPERQGWMQRLSDGLRKTGSSIGQ